jgi:hypothetical protein
VYITPLKTLLIQSLLLTFDDQYPVPEFQGIRVGMEYPVDVQQYPSIWVDYEDTQALVKAGIRHEETQDDNGNPVAPFTRWRFQGYVSLTVVALTSLERDRLFDEVINVVAFALEDTPRGRFAANIASNDLIAANLQTDRIQPRGVQAAPGTPWSTDELIYERTLNIEVIGEFVPDTATGTLVNLTAIDIDMSADITGETTPDGVPIVITGPGFTTWH